MSRLAAAFLLLPLSILLIGCPTHPSPLTQPQANVVEGAYTHVGSGMTFPITAGNFRRVTIQKLDDEGLEIGAEYTLAHPQGSTFVEVYVYPAVAVPDVGAPPGTVSGDGALLAKKEFEKRKLAVLDAHPGTKLTSEHNVAATTWSYPRVGRIATFEYEDAATGQMLRSDLWVYPFFSGRWALRYLITSPKNVDATVSLTTFMAGVPHNVPGEFGSTIPATDFGCTNLRKEKSRIYGFRPSQISEKERETKSDQMDQFWKLVKSHGRPSLECLKQLIVAEQQDGFFVFDAASLLLSLDQSPESLEAALLGVSRTDLKDIDSSAYIRMALFLFHKGVEITPLVEHYMMAPEVKGFVPQHAMPLDRETGAFFLYGSMPVPAADKSLIRMLSASEPVARFTATLLLSMSMTEEGYNALKTVERASLPDSVRKAVEASVKYQRVEDVGPAKMTREEVLKTLNRIPNYGGNFWGVAGEKAFAQSAVALLTAEDLSVLREARRKTFSGLSDEALHEYFALSQILLGVVNRLDLYRELRDH